MTKKVSLAGRKRTSELAEDQSNTKTKVDELIQLQKEATDNQPTEIKTEKPAKGDAQKPEATAEKPKPETTRAEKSNDTASKKPETAPEAAPSANKGVEAVYHKEVKAAVSKLYQAWRKFGEAGSYNRLAHTPLQQKRLFLEEMKLVMLERAEFNESNGMNELANQQDCQRYVNDIVEDLRKVGVPLSPLSVTAG